MTASCSISLPSAETAYPVTVSNTAIKLDGRITQDEWQQATSWQIGGEADTTLYLMADKNWLYVACDARDERSESGYDQLRVHLHAGLLEGLVNERIHLGRSSRLTSIRQTGFAWQGDPPQDDSERWKRYPVSDWGIYRYAAGKTRLQGHRQYEAAIHLGEAGLHHDVPFTLFVEVETDPLQTAEGKFKSRQYIGRLGSQQHPLWIVISDEH